VNVRKLGCNTKQGKEEFEKIVTK